MSIELGQYFAQLAARANIEEPVIVMPQRMAQLLADDAQAQVGALTPYLVIGGREYLPLGATCRVAGVLVGYDPELLKGRR